MQPLDARRLDRVFKVELRSMTKQHNQNPQTLLQKVLNNELQGRKLRFDGVNKWSKNNNKKMLKGELKGDFGSLSGKHN